MAVCRSLEVSARAERTQPKTRRASSGLSVEKELTNGSSERVLPSSSTSSRLLDKVSHPYTKPAVPQSARKNSRNEQRREGAASTAAFVRGPSVSSSRGVHSMTILKTILRTNRLQETFLPPLPCHKRDVLIILIIFLLLSSIIYKRISDVISQD